MLVLIVVVVYTFDVETYTKVTRAAFSVARFRNRSHLHMIRNICGFVTKNLYPVLYGN